MHPVLDQNFWNSIWSSLLSNLIFTFVIAVLVAQLISYLRKPKLEVAIDIGHRANGEKVFHFMLKNLGKQGLMQNEMQWHLYFEGSFMPKSKEFNGVIFNNDHYWEFIGFNESPILPGSCITLDNIVVNVQEDFPYEWLTDAKFYCAITTRNGTWKPFKKLFSAKPEKVVFNNGHIDINTFRVKSITQ
ncbi:hypothetical protein [Kangiella koreensis]|uniref:Uncharacterized protein n=1 Tax=Kangiella koreensis (strain DSM 16069 / JCM 12317 / KCTC 12182 / SW-125) TaxID=523791 RepID=C7R665_KANKD|nr:hypothetical protein [Kangiella koreensis]ACV25496.1 hypothetical protein Kkor_0074 [Kangiella koreensis DSM 16069]